MKNHDFESNEVGPEAACVAFDDAVVREDRRRDY